MGSQILNRIRKMNPDLEILSCSDWDFRPYGEVIRISHEEDLELRKAMKRTPVPESGNIFVASDPSLEELPLVTMSRRKFFGEMPVQAGYCNGRGYTMNALEYHRCSEVNYTTTGMVLLLGRQDQLFNGYIASGSLKAFYVAPNTAVVIHPGILHFAPLRVKEDGFNCMVILEKGTNEPIPLGERAPYDDEESLLWMRNKWLVCHSDSPQAEKGAFPGIKGRNIQLMI